MDCKIKKIIDYFSVPMNDSFGKGADKNVKAIIIIAIAAFLLISFSAVNLFQQIRGINTDLSNKVNLFAELAVNTLKEPMWNYDTNTIESIANAYFKDKEIKMVEIKTADGTVLFSKNGNDYDEAKDKLIVSTLPIIKNGYDESGALIDNQLIGNIKIGLTDYYRNKLLIKEFLIGCVFLIFEIILSVFAINTIFAIELAGKKRISATLNNMTDTVLVIDEELEIKNSNNAVKSMFGYEPCEILEVNLKQIIKEEDTLKEIKEQLKDNLIAEKEVTGIKKSGKEFPIEFNIKKMDEGSENVYILVIRDITQRYEVNKLKNEFISVVSHELRTPLTSIIGALKLVLSDRMGASGVDVKKLITIAHNNSMNLLLLINNILDVDKLENDKISFHLEAFNISEVIKTVIDNSKYFADQFSVTLNFIQGDGDSKVFADKNKVVQILTNLISNACKFSKANNDVNVYYQNIGESVKIFVSDKGSGIPKEYQSTIFDKFVQVDSSDTRKRSGTGLGLAICKTLVEKMDGTIGFESLEGKGSTFFFELPVANI